MPRVRRHYRRIKPKKFEKYGWDRNHAIYRYAIVGEKVRGLIIQNPRNLTSKQATKLAIH